MNREARVDTVAESRIQIEGIDAVEDRKRKELHLQQLLSAILYE